MAIVFNAGRVDEFDSTIEGSGAMASVKRRCATCRHFQDSEMSGRGWCTHPDRQVSSDVRILVRAAELACRNAWGIDLWADARTTGEAPAAAATRQPQLPEPEPINVVYDDEVTSVVSADASLARDFSIDDDVVQESGIVDDDQEERLELLRRDSRSAIDRARARAQQRRHGNVIETPVDPAPLAEDSNEEPTEHQVEFAPDDYVEEEAPNDTPKIAFDDDGVIVESLRAISPRSRRLRRASEEPPANPKAGNAAMNSANGAMFREPLAGSDSPDRDRFNSIPTRQADVSLPLRGAPHVEDSRPAPEPAQPDEAVRRAHSIRTRERQQEEMASRIVVKPMSDSHAATTESVAPVRSNERVIHARPRQAEPDPQPSREQPTSRRDERVRPPQEARSSWWRGNRPEQKRAEHIAATRRDVAIAQAVAMTSESSSMPQHAEQPFDEPLLERMRDEGAERVPSRRASVQLDQPPRRERARVRRDQPVERESVRPPYHDADRFQVQQYDEPMGFLDDASDDMLPMTTRISDLDEYPNVPGFDLRDAVRDPEGFSVPEIEIFPEIPRQCATCRSFRASEQDGRGWCTNDWSFAHRQMVNATELPCANSLGCWWLPADEEVWSDIPEPENGPTVRVDRMIARRTPIERDRVKTASGD